MAGWNVDVRLDDKNLEDRILALMASAGVPGLSMFAVRDNIETAIALGVRNAETKEPVDTETAFQAASLSKPVVAYLALQLADAGKLDLEEPLSHVVGAPAHDDPALATITARHVLSNTTGLPNWRRSELPMRTYFTPGSRFSYSGEGFVTSSPRSSG